MSDFTYQDMVDNLIDSPRVGTFTKWERDFLDSINDKLSNGEYLFGKQPETLNSIYNKYFG